MKIMTHNTLNSLDFFVNTLGINDQGEMSRLKMDRATDQMFSQMARSKEMCQMFPNSSTHGGTKAQQGSHCKRNQRHQLWFQPQRKE